VLFPLGLLPRNGAEARLLASPQRSAAAAKSGAAVRLPGFRAGSDATLPQSEACGLYTAELQQRILQDSEVLRTTRVALGAFSPRRSYSSLLPTGGGERAQGILEARDPTETRAEVQAQPWRRSPETSPQNAR